MLNRDLSHDEIIRYFDKLVSILLFIEAALSFSSGEGCATSLLLPVAVAAAVPAPQPALPPCPCCSLPHPSPNACIVCPLARGHAHTTNGGVQAPGVTEGVAVGDTPRR